MWTLKIRFFNKENILNKLAHKYDVRLYGYPLSTFTKNDKLYVNAAGSIIGSEKNKIGFLKELKKSKDIKNIEINNDFIIICIEQPKELSKLYSSELIHIKPVTITTKFYQEYYLGSWKRQNLTAIINLNAKNIKKEILKLKQEKIKNISISKIIPDLTDKQFQAFKLAYENNYYNFPRESELGSLSKLMKVSISTYQAHLRKTEKKIMEFFYRYIK